MLLAHAQVPAATGRRAAWVFDKKAAQRCFAGQKCGRRGNHFYMDGRTTSMSLCVLRVLVLRVKVTTSLAKSKCSSTKRTVAEGKSRISVHGYLIPA
eukprot:609313-Amphidinium_carterae.3